MPPTDPVPLAAFDLDDTLLKGDSDSSWRLFLVEEKLLDADYAESRSRQFERDYQAGRLNAEVWTRFALDPLTELSRNELTALQKEFQHRHLQPMVTQAAQDLLERHSQRGDVNVIITGTNRFISEPAAELFGVKNLLATEPEWRGDQLTGKLTGKPCYGAGKKEHLRRWAHEQGHSLAELAFYSDSINDLPLLEFATFPTAVNPDAALREIADQRGWPVLQLHAM